MCRPDNKGRALKAKHPSLPEDGGDVSVSVVPQGRFFLPLKKAFCIIDKVLREVAEFIDPSRIAVKHLFVIPGRIGAGGKNADPFFSVPYVEMNIFNRKPGYEELDEAFL